MEMETVLKQRDNMDDFNFECLNKKTLVCSGEEFSKLSTQDGCSFNVAQDNYVSEEENDGSDPESVELVEPSKSNKTKLVAKTPAERQELITREYLKVISNCCSDLLPGKYEEDDYIKIHNRFEKSKENFDDLLNDMKKFVPLNDLIQKNLYQPGNGEVIKPESIVVYNCACWTEGRKDPFDSTWLRKDTYLTDLQIDGDSLLPGIKTLLLSMRKNEWAEALIKPKAAFGKLGVPPRIPPNSTVYCVIELINVIDKEKISSLSYNPKIAQEKGGMQFEDFYRASDEARMRGNYYYEDGQYKTAIRRYRSGIKIMETILYKDEQEEAKAKALLLKLYVNMSKVANANGQPRIALSMCKQASQINPKNEKIFWQRMMAWKKWGHTELALKVCRNALDQFKTEPKVVKYFKMEERDLRERLRKEVSQTTNLYRLMGQAATYDALKDLRKY